LFLAVLACSMLDIGRAEQQIFEQHYAKWWIYITHWGLMACTLQSWLGAWIVTNGMMVDRDEFGKTTKKQKNIDYPMFSLHKKEKYMS